MIYTVLTLYLQHSDVLAQSKTNCSFLGTFRCFQGCPEFQNFLQYLNQGREREREREREKQRGRVTSSHNISYSPVPTTIVQ